MPCSDRIDTWEEGTRRKDSHVLNHDFRAALYTTQTLGRLFRRGAFGQVAGDLRPHDGKHQVGVANIEATAMPTP
ncbi:hypothetical protein SDC9_143788 [bioreactor metagenome]|uniref:Uncharacterized protein n=1 Tax=bioreactor metagenome TaxID=1076179 RepID=A0A645E732_9ZZZZ